MDAVERASIGSVISLRSVSDAPEPIRQKNRPKSAIKSSKKATGSPYGTPSKKKNPTSTKKSGREMLVTAIQSGNGLSSEGKMTNTWMNGRPNTKNRTTASEYLLEQLTANSAFSSTRAASASSTARAGGKGPVYKDPEAYYDEIQSLKRTLKGVQTENALLKAKNGRLSDEILSKSKKIEELLSPETQNNDLRRTITSKSGTTSEVVMSLKRKIYKLEENLRSKENETRKMKTEMKVTNMEEMKYENMLCHNEIVRLSQMVEELKNKDQNMISDQAIQDAMRGGNNNKTQVLLKRLTEDNRNLVLENKSLKNDLMKLTTQTDETNINVQKDYEDMNRAELLQKITNLEQKVKEEESRDSSVKQEKVDKNIDDAKVDPEVIDDRCIELKGPLPQQLKQLRARERELLSDVEKLETTVKKLKEDRSHYRKMTDDYRKQLDDLIATSKNSSATNTKKETGNDSDTGSLKNEKPTPKARKRTTSNGSQKNSSSPNKTNDENMTTPRKDERKSRTSSARSLREEKKAIISIQSSWRGHNARRGYLNTIPRNDISMTSRDQDIDQTDEDVSLIQSTFRAHVQRSRVLKKAESQRKNSVNQRRQAKTDDFESGNDSDSDDDDVVIGSSASLSRYRGNNPPTPTKRQSKSRDPTIYKDPEVSGEWYQNKNKGRSRDNMSQFMHENEAEDERRRKVDDIRKNSRHRYEDSSLKKLKSSSSPWQQKPSANQIEESDEEDNRAPFTKKSSSNRKEDAMKKGINKKWSNSASNKGSNSKQHNEENFRRQVQMRQTKELLTAFDEGDGDDDESDDDDDLIMSPSIPRSKNQQKMMMKKKSLLDDELF
eukprot:TCONS_00016693-protein